MPSTSVSISQTSASSAAASATAVVSEPPRPSVVISLVSWLTPWKPATSTMWPSARAVVDAARGDVDDPRLAVRRVGDHAGLRAGERPRLGAEVGDRHRDQRHRDPLARGEQHVHLARRAARADLLGEVEQLVGGVAHRGDDHDDVVAASWRPTIRPATRLMRSASATDEPPYFCTTSATADLPGLLGVPAPWGRAGGRAPSRPVGSGRLRHLAHPATPSRRAAARGRCKHLGRAESRVPRQPMREASRTTTAVISSQASAAAP